MIIIYRNYNRLMLRGRIVNMARMCNKKPLADWQYIAHINKSLKEGDHN